ncbi:MAG: hypothetical protein NTY15_17555 [Planctomycetota bacterium]|nr:hypothetical protein [Planctomycetota bacterium]
MHLLSCFFLFAELCLSSAFAAQMSHTQNPEVLIQNLTNKNPAPALVKLTAGSAPLFPADYDWDEDQRIVALLKGISDLAGKKPDNVWRSLIECKNEEYCICLKYPNGSGISGEVISVREICRRAAMMILMEPINTIDVVDDRGRRPFLPVFKENEFEQWIVERPQESLVELQREVLHRAIDRVEEIDRLPDPSRSKFIEALRRRESLWGRKTKTEIKQRIFVELSCYSPSDAKEIAKRIVKP